MTTILAWMFESDVVLDLTAYVAAYTRRLTILRNWTEFLAERPLVLAPVSQRRPFAPNDDVSSRERFDEILASHAPLVAVNYLGLPSTTVSTVLLDDGPIGVQLIGQPFAENVCLDAAGAIEARVGVMAEQLWARGIRA